MVTGLILWHAPRGGHIYLWELGGKTALCHLVCQAGQEGSIWSQSVSPKQALWSPYYSTKLRCFLFFVLGVPNLKYLNPSTFAIYLNFPAAELKIWHLCIKACCFTKKKTATSFFHWFSLDEQDQVSVLALIHSKFTPLITIFRKKKANKLSYTFITPIFPKTSRPTNHHRQQPKLQIQPFSSGHIDTKGGKVNSLAVNPGSIGQVLAAGEDGTVRVYAQR